MMMMEATLDAEISSGLPVQMASARQAALAWWAAQSRAHAWCDQCYRVLAWGQGYLVAAAQAHEQKPASADWLVCERCWGERRRGDSGDGEDAGGSLSSFVLRSRLEANDC